MTRAIALRGVFVLLLVSVLGVRSSAGASGKGETLAAVIIQHEGVSDALCAHLTSRLGEAFGEEGYKPVSAEQVDRMRQDAIVTATMENWSSARMAEIEGTYSVDIVVKVNVSVSSHRGVAGYFVATASTNLSGLSADSAQYIRLTASPPMGVPGRPGAIGETREAAEQCALEYATASAMHQAGYRAFRYPSLLLPELELRRKAGEAVVPKTSTRPAFTSDGTQVLVGDKSGNLVFISFDSGAVARTVRISRNRITCLSLSPRDEIVAVGTGSEALICRLPGGQIASRLNVPRVVSVDWASSGEFLVAAGAGGDVVLAEPDGTVLSRSRVGGKLLAAYCGADDRDVILVAEREWHVSAIDAKGNIDRAREQLLTVRDEGRWLTNKMTAHEVSPDGYVGVAALLTTDIDLQRNKRTDIAALEVCSTVERKKLRDLAPSYAVVRKTGRATRGLAFLGGWRFLASVSEEARLRLWDIESGQQLVSAELGSKKCIGEAIAASRPGDKLAVVLPKGVITLWEVRRKR